MGEEEFPTQLQNCSTLLTKATIFNMIRPDTSQV